MFYGMVVGNQQFSNNNNKYILAEIEFSQMGSMSIV